MLYSGRLSKMKKRNWKTIIIVEMINLSKKLFKILMNSMKSLKWFLQWISDWAKSHKYITSMYDYLYNKRMRIFHANVVIDILMHCILCLLHPCTQQKHPSIFHTNWDGVKFMCTNKNPLHQLAHAHKIIRMTNGTQILYEMIRMHYHSKMLDDNGFAYCVYVFLCSFGCIGILCDIDTRALAFESVGCTTICGM